MNHDLDQILQLLENGSLSASEAKLQLLQLGEADLGFARVDLHRPKRRGRAESIFGEGKTSEHIVKISESLLNGGQNVLITRINAEQLTALEKAFPSIKLEHSPEAHIARLVQKPIEQKAGFVAVVTGGTTDIPVAEEAAFTAETFGAPVRRYFDVGVAGIHRLFRRIDEIRTAQAVVAVAGMEGALPSVLAGLVKVPIIAVPTSVGYGANFKGVSALLTMLNSCAPGIATVNIDNGFGAGYLADQMLEMTQANLNNESSK